MFLDGDLPSGFGVERNVTLQPNRHKGEACVCPGVRDAVEVVNCTTVFRSVGCNVRYQLSRLLTRQTQVQYSTVHRSALRMVGYMCSSATRSLLYPHGSLVR